MQHTSGCRAAFVPSSLVSGSRRGGQVWWCLSIAITHFALASLLLCSVLTACPSPKMPTGPSPEYEDPPKPSWLEAGAQPAAPPAVVPIGDASAD